MRQLGASNRHRRQRMAAWDDACNGCESGAGMLSSSPRWRPVTQFGGMAAPAGTLPVSETGMTEEEELLAGGGRGRSDAA